VLETAKEAEHEKNLSSLQQKLNDLREAIKMETKAKQSYEKVLRMSSADFPALERARTELQVHLQNIARLKDVRQKLESQFYRVSGQVSPGAAQFDELEAQSITSSPSSSTSSLSTSSSSFSSSSSTTSSPPSPSDDGILFAEALFDYQANSDAELSFRAGVFLSILDQDSSGWWYAELDGHRGFVPNNFLKLIPPSYA